MTKCIVKVRTDQSNSGTNKIELFLNTEPKQATMSG
jgi:hypothetical protein